MAHQLSLFRRLVLKHLKSIVKKRKNNSLTYPDVPSGFLAVYVGRDRERFLIPVRFLHFRVFVSLLGKAEEEYGFNFSGGIVLPCEVDLFKRVLKLLEKNEKAYGGMELDELVNEYSNPCKNEFLFSSPLLNKDS
ncbi:SAUR-like auxin-responsive protein family [Euphorbia peplus]|nr:SAUR-like auxin-responsive protein family [Euphorbia peplus]